jgi:transcriptional regulator with XRE-family HTH domain
VTTRGFERAVARALRRLNETFGEDVARLRLDAGVSRAELARAAGINDSYLAKIEAGTAQPSAETCVRIGLALGADLSRRLYPATGPAIRDRHQLAMTEALLSTTNRRWTRYVEIGVRHPARGWIDAGLHSRDDNVFVASEVQSELRRFEQLVRWSEAKADSLPSWDGYGRLDGTPTVSRLLVVRDTQANRSVAGEFRRVLRAAYPARPDEALESLAGVGAWPGAAVLWAIRDQTGAAKYKIVAPQ